MSVHVDLQMAVVQALNAANLEFKMAAESADEAYHDLESITDALVVSVVRGGRTSTPISRTQDQTDYVLHVGIMKRWEGLNDADLKCRFNECDAFLEQIWKYLRRFQFRAGTSGTAMPVAFEIVPYSTDHRERLRQFTAEFTITLRRIE